MRGFIIKRELDFGDILTSFSILVAVGALWLSWHNDKLLREKEYADKIRRSTSVVAAKLDRWEELADRYFEDIQPTLVDVSEQAVRRLKSADKAVVDNDANAFLYKGLMDAAAKASQRIIEEQLQIAYMELFAYVPELQKDFERVVPEIHEVEQRIHTKVEAELQAELFRLMSDEATLTKMKHPRIEIGNALRDVAWRRRQGLRSEIHNATMQLRNRMVELIERSDAELGDAKTRAALVSVPAIETR